MTVVKILVEVMLIASSLFMILFILMHKGKGGGLSDMFGGGIANAVGSSGVAERNLNRITIGVALIWLCSVVAFGLIVKFS